MQPERPKGAPKDVRPVEGDFLCYFVQSQSERGAEHLVDLTTYRGNGACSCTHFNVRLRKMLEDGAFPDSDLRCKHIERAREYYCLMTIAALSKAANNQNRS